MEPNHHHPLLHPLIPSSTTATTTTTTTVSLVEDERNTSITPRYIFILSVVIVAVFANYQASKGFDIAVVNDLKHTPAGNKFQLHFVANDKCAQMVLRASKVVESILHPSDRLSKKPVTITVTRVTVALTDNNLTHHVAVEQDPCAPDQHYVIQLSTALMEEADMVDEVMLAVLRGMTRVWLWGGEKGAQEEIIEGIVECVICFWRGSDVPNLISTDRQVMSESNCACWQKWYCEKTKTSAVGMPIRQICESYHSLKDERGSVASQ